MSWQEACDRHDAWCASRGLPTMAQLRGEGEEAVPAPNHRRRADPSYKRRVNRSAHPNTPNPMYREASGQQTGPQPNTLEPWESAAEMLKKLTPLPCDT
jgi:hypothetical protein